MDILLTTSPQLNVLPLPMSVINFNTTNQTFRQLMGSGLTYCVPPFQRDYSCYAQSLFQLSRAITEHYDIWDENKVQARQKRLAERASSI